MDDDDIDLSLEPDSDDVGLDSTLDPIGENEDIFTDSDDDGDDYDDDLDAEATDRSGRRRSLGDIIKSWLNPKTRLKFKTFKLKKDQSMAKLKMARAKFKSKRELQHDMLKTKLKSLGKLSLALLAFKLMMDHHQDELTKEDTKELLDLQSQAKKKLARAKSQGKAQPALFLALGHNNKNQAQKVLGQINNDLGNGQSIAQAAYKLAGYSPRDIVKANTSWFDQLMGKLGFNIPVIHQEFSSFLNRFHL